ncbi:hypothetical protein ACOSP7_007279 [Xanthoceras sorbifolium]|uniref:Pectinesterase n=1 Tax=Xanthoceras sorbifolium TaxID=99658 RepID=A0ABQ8IAA2_9ROSI|nr:hypothetical protein JRO89_XS03G0168500 [Xanthoceras sorbifolium]
MSFGANDDDGANKKKKITIIGVSSLILVAMVVAVAVGVKNTGSDSSNNNATPSGQISTSSKAVTALCQSTDYKETCVDSLKSANTTDPKELVRVGFQAAIKSLKKAMENSTTLKDLSKDPRTNQALEDCHELMDSAIDDLENSFNKLGAFDMSKIDEFVNELKIWLSGAITFEESCLDEFKNITNNDAGEKMKKILESSTQLTSNGLAMMSEISSVLNSFNINRRLFSEQIPDQNEEYSDDNGSYPSWVSVGRRNLLASTASTIKPNAVVAKDGSGQYKTITEALEFVPKDNNATYVIHIKEGVYQETVLLTKHMTNVMFIGDGPTKTKITGNKNFIDGTNTMRTATVSILGANFMAKDMGFENSAGAIKHQAVALRVQAHKSIFYNCQMDGYQDTLYVHAHAQFYRDCTISGTIDFIFGDAAAIFQNCKMIVRKPLDNQNCIVTAQGRNNSRSVTGLVLQNCTITGDAEYVPVKDVNKAYLGRPWKEYSRTLIMQSQIDDIIQPDGWLPWQGTFALDTCWYGEYGNRGAGSKRNKRVKWKGIKKVSTQQAYSFTISRFISEDWINASGVPYTPGMMKISKNV